MNVIIVVFYYYVGKKKQHLLASLRKTERNIFVPSGLVTGVFEELPKAPTNYFTPNILRKSWSRLVVSVVHLDALAFPVAAT